MKILYLDCFSGISGDMLLGSLIDVGVPVREIEAALRALPLPFRGIRAGKVARQGIAAMKVDFEFESTPQEPRDYRKMRGMIEQSGLPPAVREGALKVLEALAQAESTIHGVDPQAVHFHEVGGLDTISDVVGGVAALDFLGVEQVYASPIPLGRGEISCEHGLLPNPAPATLALLKGFETVSLPYEMEFVTPTGAALLRAWVDPARPVPRFRLLETGYGAGDRDPENRPNILRALLGEAREAILSDEVALLVTDIDDETAEVLAHVTEVLFEKGALDVTSHPVLMKKGRLGTRITVVSPAEAQEDLSACLLEETSTLGVRLIPVSRRIVSRRVERVSTTLGEAAVKVAALPGGRMRIAPEYDACARLARRHHLPLRHVMDLVKREAEAALIGHSKS